MVEVGQQNMYLAKVTNNTKNRPWDFFCEWCTDRKIIERFNLELIKNVLAKITMFDEQAINYLRRLHSKYIDNISTLSNTLYKKDLERLGIDLSWKSSQIEGNRYLTRNRTVLKENVEAKGKKKEEAIMLLNHKKALDYILDSPNYFLKLDLKKS